jgi:hypothetical protein
MQYDATKSTAADDLLHQFPLRYNQKRQPRNTQHQTTPIDQAPTHQPFPSTPPSPNSTQDHQDQHQPQHPHQPQPNVQRQPQQNIQPQHQPNVQPPFRSWVSDYTWRLIDQHASARRRDDPTLDTHIQQLSQQIRKSLKRDRKGQTMEAGEKNQQLLDENDTCGAWAILRHWYQQVSSKIHKPSPLDMQEIHNTFHQLYNRDTNLPANNIPINYIATPIPNHPPNDFEITIAAQKLRLHKAPGPSGLKAEDIIQWMKDKAQTNWIKLSNLIQHVFATGQIPQRLTFSTLVLLPKSDGGVRGIGLLETIWK